MRRKRMSAAVRAALMVGMALLVVSPAASQVVLEGTQKIDFDRPESWAMKYFAAATMPSAAGTPAPLEAGEFEIGVELGQIPSLSEEERRVGFNGTKVEDLNRVPYLLRPVVTVGIGKGFALSASYLPPIELDGVEPNIFTLTLGRTVVETDGWRLGLRLATQIGSAEGDFTCSRGMVAAGDDPVANPFGCEAPSKDKNEFTTVGLEASSAWTLGSDGAWEPYVALAYHHMDLEFQVNAMYSGLVDRTRLTTDGEILTAAAGVTYRWGAKWKLTVEAFDAPLDIVRPPSTSAQTEELLSLRSQLTYRLR